MGVWPLWALFIGLWLLLAASRRAQARHCLFEQDPARHALVIGNAVDMHLGPLPSAKLDAEQVAERLSALGFAVTTISNLASVRDFEDEIPPAFRRKDKSSTSCGARHEGVRQQAPKSSSQM